MRVFLLFISSLATCLALLWGNSGQPTASATQAVQRYSFRIETPKAYVSGIMIASREHDIINGSMINEFGISAIDFSYSEKKGKVRLINVVSFLNKWYMKQVLKKDIRLCLHVLYGIPYEAGRNYNVSTHGDTVTIMNNKRGLNYTFSPLTNISGNNDTEE